MKKYFGNDGDVNQSHRSVKFVFFFSLFFLQQAVGRYSHTLNFFCPLFSNLFHIKMLLLPFKVSGFKIDQNPWVSALNFSLFFLV